jgi:hypothetical protein
VLLTVFFTVLTYSVTYIGADPSPDNVVLRCVKAVGIHALAVIAYCCLFGLISLVTKRSLFTGIIYIVVIEGLLANFPFGIRLLTVIYYTRIIAYRAMEFIVPNPSGGTENIAADAWQLNIRQDPSLLEHPQLASCLTVLLVASFICSIVAAIVFSKREFHVKTPQNS